MQQVRLGLIAMSLLLAACDTELILEGKRQPLRPTGDALTPENFTNAALPATSNNAAFSMADNGRVNPVLAPSLRMIGSFSVGAESNEDRHITSSPVIIDGMIFTKGAGSMVFANRLDGAPVWQVDLSRPLEDPDDATSGGLVVHDGVVYVASGQGEIVALNAQTGAIRWRHKTDAPTRGLPAFADGKLLFTSKQDVGYALNAETGRIDWLSRGASSGIGIVGGGAPVSDGHLAIFPLGGGVITASLLRNGFEVWREAIVGARFGRARNLFSDIAGTPVLRGGVLYSANYVGQTVAIDIRNGQRIWSQNEGAQSAPLVTENSVFVMSDEGKLLRLERATGARLWRADLPHFEDEDDQTEIIPHFGPVLAGGRLVIAGADAQLRFFDPHTGALLGQQALPARAAAAPVVAAGVLYLHAQNGRVYMMQ